MDISAALFSPETARDPYPLLARLRGEAPVHRLERYGWWAVSRHEDVSIVLRRHDLAMAVLLLIAGNETTTNLIATGTHLLLEHPEALAELRAEPALIPNFIEEVLRFEGPVMMLFRRTTAAVTLPGGTIPAGELVLALPGAANRDPAQFPDPDRFDIHRDTRGHLGFGHGIHFCVGAPLSRLEGRVAFTELLGRAPPLARVDARPAWGDNPGLRGLRALPVRFVR